MQDLHWHGTGCAPNCDNIWFGSIYTIKAFIFAECTKLVCYFTPFDWHSTPAVDVWGISPMRKREQGNKEAICYIDWCTRGFDQFGHENYDLLCGLGFAMTEMIMTGS